MPAIPARHVLLVVAALALAQPALAAPGTPGGCPRGGTGIGAPTDACRPPIPGPIPIPYPNTGRAGSSGAAKPAAGGDGAGKRKRVRSGTTSP